MTRISRPIAMTIGVFDGLHQGHQRVIAATVEAARSSGGIAWVTTFDPHPDTIVRGAPPRPWITPPEEREELLHAMGIDRVHVERFDRSVQTLPPEDFIDLDQHYYQLLPEFDALFAAGAPSLIRCDALTVRGPKSQPISASNRTRLGNRKPMLPIKRPELLELSVS